MEKRVEIIITGLVQDVNFRYYTREKAKQLSIVGYVKNIDNNKVEIVAEGDEDNLKQLADWSSHGPNYAHVINEKISWQQPTGEFNDFEVKY